MNSKLVFFSHQLNRFILLIFTTLILTSTLNAKPHIKPNFIVRSDFPKQNIWVKRFIQNAYSIIHKTLHHDLATEPKQINIIIKKNSNLKGISGNANFQENTLNFKSNVWKNDRYRRWILIHELVNLLSAHYGSQAYPSDWWSNGRSPFPVYITWLVLKELRYTKDAHWLKKEYQNKKDHQLYWALHEKYGTELFRTFFHYLKQDNISLSKIGKPWPYPDKIRSLYTMGYLSLSANKNLAKIFQEHDIGKKPSDWHKRHKNIHFVPYKITESDITNFIEVLRTMSTSKSLVMKKIFAQENYIIK